jgi:hypothetical protein
MHFPHNRNIVTIDHISSVSPNMTTDHPTSLNFPYMKLISLPQQVNYVVSSPMPSTTNDNDPLNVCSTYLDSHLIVYVVNSSIEDLEPDISLVTPIESLDIHFFQSIVLPSNEDLLESMVKTHEHSSLSISISLKNETDKHDHSSLFLSSLLRNEVDKYEHSFLSVSSSLKNETDPPFWVCFIFFTQVVVHALHRAHRGA